MKKNYKQPIMYKNQATDITIETEKNCFEIIGEMPI